MENNISINVQQTRISTFMVKMLNFSGEGVAYLWKK